MQKAFRCTRFGDAVVAQTESLEHPTASRSSIRLLEAFTPSSNARFFKVADLQMKKAEFACIFSSRAVESNKPQSDTRHPPARLIAGEPDAPIRQ